MYLQQKINVTEQQNTAKENNTHVKMNKRRALAGLKGSVISLTRAPKNKNNKCVSKIHMRQTRGAVTTMYNTVAPFSKATSPSLIVCVYIAYCGLLKLTAASNACDV